MEGATRRINRALSEAREGRGMTPADAEVMMIEDRLRGIPSTFANVDPALVGLAETAAQRSGASANIVEGAIGRQTHDRRLMGRCIIRHHYPHNIATATVANTSAS